VITRIIIGILSFSICGVIGAYCDDTEVDRTPVVKSVKGYVSAIDWVGQKLIVRTFDYGEKDDITIFVPDGCPITKGTSNIFLSDIIQSNKVTVDYNPTLSGLRALRITVKQ
jgi:hypothetical protein